MKILAKGSGWVAVDKPAGFHVHPPERGEFRVPRDRILLYAVRNFLNQRVDPIHRLDVSTSGVMLFATDKENTVFLNKQFQERRVQKTYLGVARGWLPDSGRIEMDLLSDSTQTMLPSITDYQTFGHWQAQADIGGRFPTARACIAQFFPRTGRYHQIRRHLNRVSHPLIGDSEHGDSRYNRYFREQLGFPGLCLRATALEFEDAITGPVRIEAPDDEHWMKLKEFFVANQAK